MEMKCFPGQGQRSGCARAHVVGPRLGPQFFFVPRPGALDSTRLDESPPPPKYPWGPSTRAAAAVMSSANAISILGTLGELTLVGAQMGS